MCGRLALLQELDSWSSRLFRQSQRVVLRLFALSLADLGCAKGAFVSQLSPTFSVVMGPQRSGFELFGSKRRYTGISCICPQIDGDMTGALDGNIRITITVHVCTEPVTFSVCQCWLKVAPLLCGFIQKLSSGISRGILCLAPDVLVFAVRMYPTRY